MVDGVLGPSSCVSSWGERQALPIQWRILASQRQIIPSGGGIPIHLKNTLLCHYIVLEVSIQLTIMGFLALPIPLPFVKKLSGPIMITVTFCWDIVGRQEIVQEIWGKQGKGQYLLLPIWDEVHSQEHQGHVSYSSCKNSKSDKLALKNKEIVDISTMLTLQRSIQNYCE